MSGGVNVIFKTVGFMGLRISRSGLDLIWKMVVFFRDCWRTACFCLLEELIILVSHWMLFLSRST